MMCRYGRSGCTIARSGVSYNPGVEQLSRPLHRRRRRERRLATALRTAAQPLFPPTEASHCSLHPQLALTLPLKRHVPNPALDGRLALGELDVAPLLARARAGTAVVKCEQALAAFSGSLDEGVGASQLGRRRGQGLRLVLNGAEEEVVRRNGELVQLCVSACRTCSASSKVSVSHERPDRTEDGVLTSTDMFFSPSMPSRHPTYSSGMYGGWNGDALGLSSFFSSSLLVGFCASAGHSRIWNWAISCQNSSRKAISFD